MPLQNKKKDIVLHRLHREIDEFRVQSFDNFTLEIFILPVQDAAEIVDAKGCWIGYNRYDFDPYSRDLRPKTVRMKEGRIQIWHRQQWRSMAAFLKHFKPSRRSKSPLAETREEAQSRLWDVQSKWWDANGKTFELMQLPSEIRELIYAHVFGTRIEPYPNSKARGFGKASSFFLTRLTHAGLLRTSRLVYQEASNILFKYTPFFVDRLPVLSKLLKNKTQRSRIRHLTLALDHYDFLHLFGLQTRNFWLLDPKPAAYVLRDLELDSLELRFCAPPESPREEWLDNGCQKQVVDWTLEAAFPFIRKHPVELTGYIKDSSRALFETQKAEERERIDLWQRGRIAAGHEKGSLSEYYEWLDEEEGGVFLDESRAYEEWMKKEMEKEIPPVCYCRRRCSATHWTSNG